MNAVNKTLYIPLFGKAEVSRKGIIIKDPKAEEIWKQEGFALHGKAKSRWLAYYMAMRARVFDEWTKNQLQKYPEAIILHIGCGMDSRVERINAFERIWYDIDYPSVIQERMQYFTESDNYRMLSADASDIKWINGLEKGKEAIVIMEGISMYLTNEELGSLFLALQSQFANVLLLMDSYTVFGAKASRFKNPVNDVGAKIVSGIDYPEVLEQNERIHFAGELDMTPSGLVDELSAFEQIFFRLMFAGKAAKRIYRLYEYKIIK
ncbi:O-methyltransferase involved in polyketide biosynthesis [Kineothrix alysoides]|uniref:O-methyltransferase involved in polyketide biosynthesis n=1 Tax=Kineothrix alysoides TaxID=1469948 RepID=A0A4V2QBI1_9FIRM|nr:class I SAM-dependent methyltransferase [Kineothrix alysoides]TCL56242.1 O-methyltransferase involved in polyketide biosynthesis [Kineothrix alysoides]